MRNFDLTPLFHTTIGFDRLSHMIDGFSHVDERTPSYPPYDIEKVSEDTYRITMAVAGFGEKDIELTQHENSLVVKGKAPKTVANNAASKFLHQGIAKRGFERTFQLADYIRVVTAKLDNGLLSIELEREVPEEMKPRRIEIQSNKSINHKNAA